MLRTILAAAMAMVVAVCAWAAPAAPTKAASGQPASKGGAPPAKPARPRPLTQAEILAKRIAGNEAKLRTEKDPVERQRLIDDSEACRHEMGPRDPAGARNHPAAMWHDTAIDALDADYKRFAGRAKTAPAGAAAALVMEARANLRRMALTCLLRGWGWGGTLPKYQYDAYGAYLANNMSVVDALFDSVAAALAKEATLPPAAPDRDAFLAALAQVKDGCARMNQAAETFCALEMKTPGDRQTVLAALGSFHEALETVVEADGVLKEQAGKAPLVQAGAAAGAGQESAAGGPPQAGQEQAAREGPSPEEKARLEKVRAAVAALPADDAWAKTREGLERLAAVAEQGLLVPRMRAGAQELLHHLVKTADFAEGLARSKSAYPEYAAPRHTTIAEAFDYMAKRGYRQWAYSRLRRMYEGDRDRLAIDASPLSPQAAKGLLRAAYYSEGTFTGPDRGRDFSAFYYARLDLMSILGKLPRWPPKDMSATIAPLYRKFCDVFVQAAEAAGKAPAEDPVALKDAFQAAAKFGKDLERVVLADQGIRAVEQFLPARAAPMAADFIRRAEPLAGNLTVAANNERLALDQFLLPFQELADLDMPGPAHEQVALTLTGGAYGPARAMLSKQLATALADASKGRSANLDVALEARYMFKALRHRCVGETDGLARVGVANLDAFSMSEKSYAQFVAALDGHLKRLLAKYATQHTVVGSPQCSFLWKWDSVYCMVGAAERLTLKARHPGETDLEFLMRNLAQAADPTPPDTAWFGWACGYHALEAAVCLAAGYDGAAGYHLGELKLHRGDNRFDRELSTSIFDPK
ncbi:MAG: hypothetical protein FJ288_00695 [Planctomycetes bacterium]|nr:hypothetical protein [Planctomycetota bacterium]